MHTSLAIISLEFSLQNGGGKVCIVSVFTLSAIVSGGGKLCRPPLHPVPVTRSFQIRIIGVDIMDLPAIQEVSKNVVVFQDYLIKWPLA